MERHRSQKPGQNQFFKSCTHGPELIGSRMVSVGLCLFPATAALAADYSADINQWNVSLIFFSKKECWDKMLSSFYFLFCKSLRQLRSLLDHDIYVACSAGVRRCCLLCWWPLTSNRLSCNPMKKYHFVLSQWNLS